MGRVEAETTYVTDRVGEKDVERGELEQRLLNKEDWSKG